MNGQWVSGDRGSHIVWELEEQQLSEDKYINTWKVKREEELLFSEIADRAEWGTFYFSAAIGTSNKSGANASTKCAD